MVLKSRFVSYLNVTFLLLSTQLYATAQEISVAEMDKLQKASVLAYRVVEKANDYSGAVRVLEEAGIIKVKQARPGNYPVSEYTKLLYVYAKSLFHMQTRYEEAGPILKLLFGLKPDNYKINFLYGDFFYRQYKSSHNQALRSKAALHYNRYLSLLRENKLSTALPMRVIEIVYGGKQGGMCALLGERVAKNKVSDLYDFFNPESSFEQLGGSVSELSELEFGVVFKSFLQTGGGVVWRSKIDIDNDGVQEIRYYKRLQPSNCLQNLFYKPDQNTKKNNLMKNALFTKYFQPGSFCGESKLSFVKYDQWNYILERQVAGLGLDKYSLYKLDAEGSWENLCDFNLGATPVAKPVQVQSECDAEVCKHLSAKASKLIESKGQAGIEVLLHDRSGLMFDQESLGLDGQKFVDSQYLYKVDFDNDGLNDLISRLWLKNALGDTQYQYRLFRLNSNKRWQALELPILNEDEWFFVESFKGINYIVTYEMLETTVDSEHEFMTYNLRVYYLQRDELKSLGRISFNGQ